MNATVGNEAGGSRDRQEVEIVEVCPRDGLQNEERVVSTDDKVALIYDVIGAGVRRIEVTAFVHPRRVPQMADADAVAAALEAHPGVAYAGLVLNLRGAERAVATRALDEVNYVVPLTDSFGRANQGTSTSNAIAALPAIQEVVLAAGLRFSVTLAVAFGCPYEGEVPVARLARVAAQVTATAPHELALADTIGSAVPADTVQRIRAVKAVSGAQLRMHFHETRHTALANCEVALREGVRVLDASAAGIGGCPFAPGAAGNVATEDLVWMLHRSGYRTGIDNDLVVTAGQRICDVLGVASRSGVGAAGSFPAVTCGR